ncbi:unnamed protein product [Caenorhabditis auriculariae]|uniref:Uncharacterized protein n=1 Tax=Caenorhabditis auriculariae TaxID=2777116 RepID=A0A8S1H8R5_9PELO|nr:unnamed protein product [Caenorhabditis auriculariae]
MNRFLIFAILVAAAGAFNYYREDGDQLLIRAARDADSSESNEKIEATTIEASGELTRVVREASGDSSSSEESDEKSKTTIVGGKTTTVVEGSGINLVEEKTAVVAEITSAPVRFIRSAEIEGSGIAVN